MNKSEYKSDSILERLSLNKRVLNESNFFSKITLDEFLDKMGVSGNKKEEIRIKSVFDKILNVLSQANSDRVSDNRILVDKEKIVFKPLGSYGGDLTDSNYGDLKYQATVSFDNVIDVKDYFNYLYNKLKKDGFEKQGNSRLIYIDSDYTFFIQISKNSFYVGVKTLVDNPEEGTDVSGVATPTGGFKHEDIPDEKKRIVIEAEDKDEKDNYISDIKCPKCDSHNVNIHNNGSVFHCVDCGYDWSVNNDEVEDDTKEEK